uniref:G-protein coupled receptors family 1 profile domain-containing protein n=1 Tax=Oryzias latipes TaxID=8090 RepID=A0A3P9JRX0_ORYLA
SSLVHQPPFNMFSSSAPSAFIPPSLDLFQVSLMLSTCFPYMSFFFKVKVISALRLKMGPSTSFLMLSLAVSNLLCLLTIPFGMYALLVSWTLGPVNSCKLLTFFAYCSSYGSRLTVTVLSVQRYLLVVHQKNWTHQTGVRLLLVLLWLVSIILSIPPLWITVLLVEGLVGFTIFFLAVFSYTRLQKKVKQAAFFNNPQTTRLVTSIIMSLLVFWVPYLFFNVLCAAAIFLHNEEFFKYCLKALFTVKTLLFVNSCLNPVLYAFTSHILFNIAIRLKSLAGSSSQMRPGAFTELPYIEDYPSSSAYPGPGRGGSRLSRDAQTSLTPATSSSSSGGTPRRSQASRET